MKQTKLAIACQGGGRHTAFTAGVLKKLLELGIPKSYKLIALSGTSGGGICAAAVWYGLLKAATGSKEPPYNGSGYSSTWPLWAFELAKAALLYGKKVFIIANGDPFGSNLVQVLIFAQ